MPPSRLAAAAAVLVLAGGVTVATRHPAHDAARPVADTAPSAVAHPAPTVARPDRHAVAPSRPRPRPHPAKPAVRLAVAPPPLFPLPAQPAYPHPCPPPPIPPGPPFKPPTPKVGAAHLPAPLPALHRHVRLSAVRGKGMWLTTWQDTYVNVPRVVAQAKAAGLRQLWVRTGGSLQGWYGRPLLTRLLPAAHAAGIAVIAWDFPTLSDPMSDVRRAHHDLAGTFGGQHLDGFSPDIETIYEGTFDTARRVRVYLSRIQHDARSMPVIATVLRPTAAQLASYPYAAEAPYVDVFAPMVYWSCNEPGVTALASLRPLAKLRPVHLIGQSYDMGPEGGRHGLPTGREIWRFLDVAKRGGAIGASLYVYNETRWAQWRALSRYPWAAKH